MRHRLAIVLAALWWGGITALSFLAVPVLFAQLGNPAVAGPVAARLFSLQCLASMAIGAVLFVLLFLNGREGARRGGARALFGPIGLAMALAIVQEFGVAHQIVTARATGGDLRFWHALGSAMVLGQWLCSGALLWRLTRAPVQPA